MTVGDMSPAVATVSNYPTNLPPHTWIRQSNGERNSMDLTYSFRVFENRVGMATVVGNLSLARIGDFGDDF
jgi:hypothetical protein